MKTVFTIQRYFERQGETYALIKVNNDGFVSHAELKKDSDKFKQMFGSSEVYTPHLSS